MASTTASTAPRRPRTSPPSRRASSSVWASGDYGVVAARIPVISELLCDAAGPARRRAACWTWPAAPATPRWPPRAAAARVTSLDYVPALLERAAQRAAAEGLEVELVEGDAQALPFADGSFDAVVSVVGVMFAPDQRRTAAEMLRVCRPGGTIALASWTPDGFIGELFRTIGAARPAAGRARPAAALGQRGPRPRPARRRRDRRCAPGGGVFTYRYEVAGGVHRRSSGPTTARPWRPSRRCRPRAARPSRPTSTALARRHDRLGGGGPSRSRPSTWRSSRPGASARPGPIPVRRLAREVPDLRLLAPGAEAQDPAVVERRRRRASASPRRRRAARAAPPASPTSRKAKDGKVSSQRSRARPAGAGRASRSSAQPRPPALSQSCSSEPGDAGHRDVARRPGVAAPRPRRPAGRGRRPRARGAARAGG